MIEDNIARKTKTDLETSTGELKNKLFTKDADFDSQMEKNTLILYKLCIKALKKEKSRQEIYLADLSEFMTLTFGSISGGTADEFKTMPIEGYRRTFRNDTSLHIKIESKNPSLPFSKGFVFDFLVPIKQTENADIFLTQVQPPTNRKVMYSRLSELEGSPKSTLLYRLDQWAKSALEEVISDFNKNI